MVRFGSMLLIKSAMGAARLAIGDISMVAVQLGQTLPNRWFPAASGLPPIAVILASVSTSGANNGVPLTLVRRFCNNGHASLGFRDHFGLCFQPLHKSLERRA